mmetsp:Transcript_68947/g.202386  ORF Transcript_68947/g.202386 Transcript_68947/m.202386 type:complete len:1171 (-) Transcript_68947:103-3615(-)
MLPQASDYGTEPRGPRKASDDAASAASLGLSLQASAERRRVSMKHVSTSNGAGKDTRMKRSYSWDNMTTAPEIDRTPVRLYLNERQACMALLHVRCQDQVGFLFTLSDMVMRHGIDVDRADIATVGKDVDNRFILRASRPSDFADAKDWCEELKDFVQAQPSDIGGDGQVKAQLAAAASRLSVNPHLLCVSVFQKLGMQLAQSIDGKAGGAVKSSINAGKSSRCVYRYRLELKGINQAGLLAYMSLVLSQSGFSIVRAHVSTVDGCVADVFDLKTEDVNAERRLRSYINLPTNMEVNLSLPELQALWSGGSPAKGLVGIMNSPMATPSKQDLSSPLKQMLPPASPGLNSDVSRAKRFELSNGDVYEGDMDKSNQRQGHGMYLYAGGQATYKQYSGQWLDNKKHGFGTLIFRDGSAYVGQWKASKRHGIGVYFGYGSQGASGPGAMPTYRYEGEWASDHQCGLGVEETEDYLYCGYFSNGLPSGSGMKIMLRVPGLAGCSVLQDDSSWTPLMEAMRNYSAEEDKELREARRNARADSTSVVENSSLNASTWHLGAGAAASLRAGLADIKFEKGDEDESTLAPLPAKPLPAEGPGILQDLFQKFTTPGSKAEKLAEKLATPLRSVRWRDLGETQEVMVVADNAPVSRGGVMPTPQPLRPAAGADGELKSVHTTKRHPLVVPTPRVGRTPGGGLHRVTSIPAEGGGGAAAAAAFFRTCSTANPGGLLLSPSKTALDAWREAEAEIRDAAAILTSPQGALRRALTPESKVELKEKHIIACPMLWGSDELACIIKSIGVGGEVDEKLRGIRLTGTAQLLEMSNSQMSQDLGLSAPLERLAVRRCLQHLTEADRYENSARGRSVLDVMNDTTLKPFIIPLSDLTLVQNLSQGGFGMVYKGTLKVHEDGPKQKSVAVKEMLGDQRVQLYECLKEAHVMASLKHKNICKFIGVCADGKPRGKRYIVSALLDCSLFDLVHRPARTSWNGQLDIPLAISLAQGICAGLAYIHSRSLVHADLKSSNILIDLSCAEEDDYKPVPRICDFGHAAVRTAATPHDRLCTPHWAAPEVLRSEGLGPAADIFSVGVLLWEMLAKRVPHCDLGFGQVLAAVGWAGLIPDLALLPPIPEELRRILQTCLSFLPDERPSAKDVKRRLQRLPKAARLEALKMLQTFVGIVT